MVRLNDQLLTMVLLLVLFSLLLSPSVHASDLIKSFSGHTEPVSSVAFSPNGKAIASGSEDKTIKLWNVGNGKLITTLKGHSRGIKSVVFSPDGKTLATGGYDHTIRLWNITNSKLITILGRHQNSVKVAFSPDGKTIVSGSKDRTIKLWSVESGKLITTLKEHSYQGYSHQGPVLSVAYSPDGKTIASSSYQTIKLWNVENGKVISTFKGNSEHFDSIIFSPDGKTLASSSYQTIKLWNVKNGKVIITLKGKSGDSIAFSPDGKILASGGDKTIKLWNVNNGALISTFEGHKKQVDSVAFSPDGKTLASGSGDKSIKLWNVENSNLITIFESHSRDPQIPRFDSEKIGTSDGFEKSGSIDYNLHTSMISNIDETPKIEQITATTLIQEHAANSYITVHIGTFPVKDEAIKKIGAEDICAIFGLITVEYKAKKDLSKMGIPGMMQLINTRGNHPSITTKLTRKGERVGTHVRIRKSDSSPEVGFPKGGLIVDRIVSISQDNVVLFAITHKSNELGKKLEEKDEKLRGKATFKYDPFLEKFIFTGFWLSGWEEQKWEGYYWVKKGHGKRFLIYGSDTTLPQTTQQIAPIFSHTPVNIVSYFQACAPMDENHTCSVGEVSRLISAGADVNRNQGNTPLRLAIIKSLPIEFLNILIASGANVKANAQGTTLLNDVVNNYIYGFRDGGKEARKKIEILTNAGLDINTVDTQGYTALMTAVRGSNLALVKMIMEAGCDVSIRNRKGQSAYDIVLEQLKEHEKPVKPGTLKGIVEARKRIINHLKEMATLTRFNS